MVLSCRLGERLCRCINSAQSRNLRHALTPSASELAAKHCPSGSPRRMSRGNALYGPAKSGFGKSNSVPKNDLAPGTSTGTNCDRSADSAALLTWGVTVGAQAFSTHQGLLGGCQLGAVVSAREQVTITIGGHLDRRVPEPRLNHLERQSHPLRD